jgi:entericidin B
MTSVSSRRPALALAALVAVVLSLSLTACNTARGVGEDIQAGGRAISGAADATGEAIEEAVD